MKNHNLLLSRYRFGHVILFIIYPCRIVVQYKPNKNFAFVN